MNRVKLRRLYAQVKPPQRMSQHASGYDLCAFLDQSITLTPGERTLIPTGLQIEMSPGMEAQIRPRSGLAWKQGLTVINTPGTIDADYRGEIKVALINLGQETVTIASGDRIAQIVFCPVLNVQFEETTLEETPRGVGGFGSTGVRE